MRGVYPDTTGLEAIRNQPEFPPAALVGTGTADGRIGFGTMLAVRNFQRKVGMQCVDGCAGIKLLARLRQGS